MSVASWSGSLLAWDKELTALKARVGRVLRRRELRETGAAFLDGLLSGIERKTGWLMAEQSGAERPYRMQSLLGRSQWDADRLRDEVRAYVVELLGDADGVLIVDETGFVKKGDRSAGVARQYSGTAGRIENCQIGVFLAYASRYGQALIDRRLYLPERWTKDRVRCASASIPETVAFETKPKMARAMVAAALDAGVPCAYVLGDWSMARTAAFAACSRLAISLMSWRSAAPTSCGGAGSGDLRRPRPKTSPANSNPRTGSVMRRAKAPKAHGSTTGPASAAPGHRARASSTGF